jgi:hypothetical protein
MAMQCIAIRGWWDGRKTKTNEWPDWKKLLQLLLL